MNALKQFNKMQGIAATRIRLGLTQEAFAAELDISRSLLCKAENNTRKLSARALGKLAALEITLAAAATAERSLEPHPVEMKMAGWSAASGQWSKKQETARWQALKCQRTLDLMTERYHTLRRELSLNEALTKANTAAGNIITPVHLQLQYSKLCLKLHSCSLEAQANLRHKIALQNAAAELHGLNGRMGAGS